MTPRRFLGFRGVDGDNPGVEILHRGKTKRLSLCPTSMVEATLSSLLKQLELITHRPEI
jgi:hypothetical protein